MPELWDQLTQQPVAEPPSMWPQGDRAPLRITVGGPTMKDGAQASSGSSLDPFNPPQVEYVGTPLANTLWSAVQEVGRKGRGLMTNLMDAEAERAGSTPTVSTDYDPKQEAISNLTPLLANLWGVGAASIPKGAVGAVGSKMVQPAVGEAAPPFYSALMRSIEGAKLNKASPEQWLGYLRNQPGVKAEEIDRVLGNLPAEGMLTRPDMQAHAAENAVQLGEVNKSNIVEAPGFGTAQEQAAAIRRYEEAHRAIINGPVGAPEYQLAVQEFADAQAAMRDTVPGWGRSAGTIQNPAKYDQWQLPGGENYREKLLTLPDKGSAAVEAARTKADQLGRQTADAMSAWKTLAESNPPGHPETLAAYQRVSALRREANAAFEQAKELSIVNRDANFKSSHWDEPNVLAHIRMNDREVPGVGKSLHLEEIQSDWHQKGRSEGYAGKEFYVKNEASGNKSQPFKTEAEAEAFRQTLPPRTANQTFVEGRDVPGIPDAPFKSTWADVSLKRAIRDAAEGGYDALSWTPGEAQAARYDLSKQISKIDYNPESGKLWGYDHHNNAVMDTRVSNDKLADHIGKEAAEKLLGSQADKGWHRLEGTDLKIGGEGMKAFYDKMLVDKANALGKKHGARVEQAEIPVKKPTNEGGVSGEMIMDDMGIIPSRQAAYWRDLSQEERDKLFEEYRTTTVKEPVHVLRITPQLREAAMKGFPLFTALFGGAATAPSLWPQEGRQ